MRKRHYVMNFFILVMVAVMCPVLFMAGCSPRVVTVTEIRDSVRTEIRERLVHDTLKVEIPKEVVRNVTEDTLSHVETSFAVSDAVIFKGRLYHSIENKPGTWQKPVTYTVHDTVTVTKYSEKQAEVREVEKGLSWWQKTQMILCWVFFLVIASFVFYKLK